MREVLKYLTKEQIEGYKKRLKNGQTVVIYHDDRVKIRLKKIGRKYITSIIEYGNKDILDIVNNLLIKAS